MFPSEYEPESEEIGESFYHFQLEEPDLRMRTPELDLPRMETNFYYTPGKAKQTDRGRPSSQTGDKVFPIKKSKAQSPLRKLWRKNRCKHYLEFLKRAFQEVDEDAHRNGDDYDEDYQLESHVPYPGVRRPVVYVDNTGKYPTVEVEDEDDPEVPEEPVSKQQSDRKSEGNYFDKKLTTEIVMTSAKETESAATEWATEAAWTAWTSTETTSTEYDDLKITENLKKEEVNEENRAEIQLRHYASTTEWDPRTSAASTTEQALETLETLMTSSGHDQGQHNLTEMGSWTATESAVGRRGLFSCSGTLMPGSENNAHSLLIESYV